MKILREHMRKKHAEVYKGKQNVMGGCGSDNNMSATVDALIFGDEFMEADLSAINDELVVFINQK